MLKKARWLAILRPFWLNSKRQDCLKLVDPWAARLRTARAAALLCLARVLIAVVPFHLWRRHLGGTDRNQQSADPALDPAEVHQLAAHVARAALRLPFPVKCLPQAMALSWQLRRRRLPHTIVFAARPPGARADDDALHAWVENGARVILGDLPGPWIEIYRQPSV
jgi:hypothetical protein